jgi:hypothetical protein
MKTKSILTLLGLASCLASPVPAQEATPTALPSLVVQLPVTVRPLPEPLPAGQNEPGFTLRGIKGWMWKPEQYLAEIPVLAQYKMNFLMNCYTSMCDIEHHPWGDLDCNRWWEPLPVAKRNAYARVVKSCVNHGIRFCFSMNPNLFSKRFADAGKPEDVENLWQHYQWMQGLGVRWFNISLDDISQGIDAKTQAALVNEIFRRLRQHDPEAQMIFCPTYYWGDGTDSVAQQYLRTLASNMHPDVYVFWTGDQVVTPQITRKAAESYRKTVGHRMILWDNYPVNDNTPTMHLGPVTGRDADLCEVIEGYMSNPLCPQNEINRIPMLTCADYAYNPRAYDPARSIGQSIAHLAGTQEQRMALKDLVERYPGMLLYHKGTSYNPVRERFTSMADRAEGSSMQKTYIAGLEQLLRRFRSVFGARFRDGAETLSQDIEWLRAQGQQ